MHPVELFGRLLAVLLGLLGFGATVDQGLLGVGAELVAALFDRERRAAEELRILVGLANDDLDRAPLTGRHRARIPVATLEEFDQAPPQRVFQVPQGDATGGLDIHGVPGHDQLDRVPAGDLTAGIALAVDVQGGQRRLASFLDEGVDVDPGFGGGNRLATGQRLELGQVLLGDRVDRVHLQRGLVGLDGVVVLTELGIGLSQAVEGVLVRPEPVHDAAVDLDGFGPLVLQGQLDRLVDVLSPRFDAFGEFSQSGVPS